MRFAGRLLALLAVVACTMGDATAPLLRQGLAASVVSVGVTWTATCGTITSAGDYTAPSSGSCRIIATAGGKADTAFRTVASADILTGIPFGPTQADATECASLASLTACMDGVTPSTIVSRINAARSSGRKLLTNMTGGAHSLSMTNGVFDFAKWAARMDGYKTFAIQTAVANAVADKVLIGNSVMDEPFNTGGANSWGPAGTMTKAKVDQLCAYAKGIFPTLPQGAFHDHRDFEPTKNYAVCDFFVAQYRNAKGDLTVYRDGAVAAATRQGMSVAFSLNFLDGGQRDNDKDTAWECPIPLTGGEGTYFPNCKMSPDDIVKAAAILGPAGCGLMAWRYDLAFFTKADNRTAMAKVSADLATRPGKRCVRT